MFAVILVSIVGFDTPVVYKVEEGGPAWEAGIRDGDVIQSVNGKKVHMYKEFRIEVLMNSGGAPMEMVLSRNGSTYGTTVTPELGSDGTYKIQIYGGQYERTGVLDTLKYSVFEVRYWITTTVRSLGMLITGQVSANDLSGPVGIVDMIDDTYQEARSYGWLDVLLNLSLIHI